MAKVWILNPFFPDIFSVFCFVLWPFLWLEIHILFCSQIFFSCTTNPARMQLERKKLSGTQKNCKHCSRSCAFPQSMILFSVVHVFCVKFVGKMMCLRKCWCFLQGWYLCQIERRAVVYIFRKDVYQEFNFWTVFLHR